MKKTITPFFILFFAVFTAFGQSITLTPSNFDQLQIKTFGILTLPYFSGFRGLGTTAAPLPIGINRTLAALAGFGYNGSGFSPAENASILLNANQTFTTTANGTHIRFNTTANNTTTIVERMRISDVGNVGIGTSSPNAPLQFPNDILSRKIVLFETANNDNQYYGFGINGGMLRYQTDTPSSDHVFFSGTTSTTSSELMRIKGNGNVGIGTTTPTAKLEVNGYTKLGTDAPAIKVKKYLSTTALSQGATATIAHGLTYSKIISATVLVEASQGKLFPPNITRTPNVQYDYDIDGANIYVTNQPSNSFFILNQRIIIMITYEE